MANKEHINDINGYLLRFPTDNGKASIRAEALKHALDIRKFEIELYWKRATYFWAFIAVTFGGYFALSNSTVVNNWNLVLVCLLGFVFSMSWHFVNRGSKFWQDNWERHVDYLEDEIIGPLYKMAKNPAKCKATNPMQEYPFSVSKINLLLSIVVTGIWIALLCCRIYEMIKAIPTISVTCKLSDLLITVAIALVIVLVSFFIFIVFGKSKLPKTDNNTKGVKFVIRDYE